MRARTTIRTGSAAGADHVHRRDGQLHVEGGALGHVGQVPLPEDDLELVPHGHGGAAAGRLRDPREQLGDDHLLVVDTVGGRSDERVVLVGAVGHVELQVDVDLAEELLNDRKNT